MDKFCVSLPKIELHAHLHGSIRNDTLADLAKAKLPSDDVDKYMKDVMNRDRAILECFVIFDLIYKLCDDLPTIRRITEEVILDFARDNVAYLELRTTPRAVPATGMTKEGYLETVLDTIARTTQEHHLSMVTRVLVSINRAGSPADAVEHVQLAYKYRERGIVGMDLGGNPVKGSFDTLVPAFTQARQLGLPFVLHYAEVKNPSEGDLMIDMRPARLGHACYMTDDHFKRLEKDPIPIEICLTSNLLTESAPSVEEHHVRDLITHNYPISLSTDDMGVFNTSLSREYTIFASAFRWTKQQLFTLSYQALDYILLDDDPAALKTIENRYADFAMQNMLVLPEK